MSDAQVVAAEPAPKLSFADRVAAQALEVRFARLLLSLLAFPFYLLGLVLGLVVLAVRWCYAAVQVGIADVTKRGADAG